MPSPIRATAATWLTDFTVYPAGSVLIETDTGVNRYADGVRPFFQLPIDRVGPDIWIEPPATAVTGAVTLTAAGTYLVGSGGAPTLPTAVGNTSRYTIKNTTSGNITLATTSSQTVDGGAAPITVGPQASVSLISDNANWWVL